MHEGHRKRLRERLVNQGIDSLETHELLELFLYAYIPRKDTNSIAHQLIDIFGSASAVCDAEIEDLVLVKGMTYNAAIALHTIPFIIKRYYNEKNITKKNLSCIVNAIEYLKNEFKFLTKERLLILCLDVHFNLIKSVVIKSEEKDRVTISMKEIHSAVLRHSTKNIIIAHNHPSGSILPSDDDINMTKNMLISMPYIDVKVIDHIIIADDKYYSFREKGLLNEMMPGEIINIKHVAEKALPGVNINENKN